MKRLFLIIGLISFFGMAFAADSNDCGSVTFKNFNEKRTEASWKNYKPQLAALYPYENLKIAFLNLKAYCCKEYGKPGTGFCLSDTTLPVNYPDSPYLYDHLVDVGLRSLDVIGVYPGQVVDSTAKNWNDIVQSKMSNANGVLPITVLSDIEKIWTIDNPKNFENFEALSTTASLADKYYGLCYVVKNIYDGVKNPDIEGYHAKCLSLADYRVKRELVFAKVLMIDNATRVAEKTIKSYFVDEFLQNRMMSLFDKFSKIRSYFVILGKQAPLAKKCN